MSFEKMVKVICFYTPNPSYQQEVIALQESALRFSIPLEVAPYPKTLSKPACILKTLKETKSPILWVDSNYTFEKEPNFAQFEAIDFSLEFKSDYTIKTSKLFINQTKPALKLLKKWSQRHNELVKEGGDPTSIDQIALFDVLQKNKKAKVLPMTL